VQRAIRTIDAVTTFVGKTFAWLILALTFVLTYEVVSRYFFGRPTLWAFDASYMIYGAYFMMGSAYTLARNAHVRGDIFYRRLPDRSQAAIDLTLYVLVFFPAMIALAVAGWAFFWDSFLVRETSPLSPIGTPIYPLKAMIPAGAFLLVLQGVAQVFRCILAIQTGRWTDNEEPQVVA
jgi:TRAP-type mannitol/chloroaromatic compound transport system permease small subunit